jgi:hypothetical protein
MVSLIDVSTEDLYEIILSIPIRKEEFFKDLCLYYRQNPISKPVIGYGGGSNELSYEEKLENCKSAKLFIQQKIHSNNRLHIRLLQILIKNSITKAEWINFFDMFKKTQYEISYLEKESLFLDIQEETQ